MYILSTYLEITIFSLDVWRGLYSYYISSYIGNYFARVIIKAVKIAWAFSTPNGDVGKRQPFCLKYFKTISLQVSIETPVIWLAYGCSFVCDLLLYFEIFCSFILKLWKLLSIIIWTIINVVYNVSTFNCMYYVLI